MSPRDPAVRDLRSSLVRLTLLVRLLALAYGLLGLVLAGGDRTSGAGPVLLFTALVVTSHLGLQHQRVRDLVVRHPVVALVDLVPVALIPFVMGHDSPIGLVSLSSMLLIGVLFTVRTAVPLALLLAVTSALAGVAQDLDVVSVLRTPVVLLSLAGLGAAIRHQSEQQLRSQHESALALQAAAAAQERLRLARDLHDTVAKSVQGVALTAAALPCWIERDPDAAASHAASVAEAARTAVAAARNLLSSLRMDDPSRPLADVVDELVYRWEADSGTTAQRLVDDVQALPPGHRHELLVALSEALENVARHAPGARVTVSLEQVDDRVVVSVVDDGPGFPAAREAEAEQDGHYGLVGMRERLEGVGGGCDIRSAPGFGTQVRLEVPVPAVGLPPVTGSGPAAAAQDQDADEAEEPDPRPARMVPG